MKAIFFHVPKTGGVAIGTLLHKVEEVETPPHIEYDTIHEKYSQDILDRSIKCAFVRNPFDRFVSAYHYLYQQDENHKYWIFDRPVSSIVQKYHTFNDFCRIFNDTHDINTYCHFIPMEKYLCKDDKIMMDFIGRFERIEEDYRAMKKIIGIHAPKLEKRNVSIHGPWQEYYKDSFAFDLVRRWYRKDFEIFNYSMEI